MADSDGIYEELLAIFMLLKRSYMTTHMKEAAGDLSLHHLGVLGVLSKERRIPTSELARRMFVAKPQMTLILDKLEGSGLVRRVADPGDRRVTAVELTEKGGAVLGETMERCRDAFAAKLSDLAQEDRDELSRSLASLRRILGRI